MPIASVARALFSFTLPIPAAATHPRVCAVGLIAQHPLRFTPNLRVSAGIAKPVLLAAMYTYTLFPDNRTTSAKSRPLLERKDSHKMTAPADTPVNDSVRSSNVSPTQYSNSYSTSESNRALDESSTDTAAFDALKRRFAEVSHLDILVHCMGGPRVSNIPNIAKDLAEHIIVICVDCEHWSNNTDEPPKLALPPSHGMFYVHLSLGATLATTVSASCSRPSSTSFV